jgi:acyl-coenzyme A thioesterase PaaI-like protein
MSNWPQIKLDTNRDYNHCFGCGQDNPIGFRLKLQTDGKTVRTEFTPGEQYQGWPGYLHGGITACLLDEVMSQAAHVEGLNCITARLETRLMQLIPINETLTVTSAITQKKRKLIKTISTIYLKDGTVAAEGIGTHFVVSPKENKIQVEE